MQSRKKLANLLLQPEADMAILPACSRGLGSGYRALTTCTTWLGSAGLGALCAVMASFLAEASSCSGSQGDVTNNAKLTGGLHCSLQTFLQ